MSSYRVIVTEVAEGEINSALEYLLLRSPDAARDFQDGMDEAILSLSEMPRRCPLAPEDGVITRPLRQLIYRHGRTAYRILFTIFEAEGDAFEAEGDAPAFVRILRVLHGAQQQLGLLIDDSDED